ncbi:unnamed protein product, partial [Rotaria sp. Silwood1]
TLLLEDNKLIEVVITNLVKILNSLTDFYLNRTYNSSLLISLCKITKSELCNLLIRCWGTEIGICVLKKLNKLYLTLIWEKSILLSLCSFETNIIDQKFNKNYLLKLFPITNDICIQIIKSLLCVSSKLDRIIKMNFIIYLLKNVQH